MARPSSTYPSERPGSTCGASWPDPIRVTGRLSQTNSFGSNISVELDPVADADDMRRSHGMLSWNGAHEARVREELEERIRNTLDDLVKFRDALGEENRDAVEGLLRMAVDNLDYIEAIHKKWTDARWPMSRGHYNDDHCTREVDMGKVFGGGFDRCPTYDTHIERNDDRDEIARRFVDACHAIRCAEFGMWRVVLYRRALKRWKKTPQGGGPGGLAPKPPATPRPPMAGGGTFATRPPGPLPPPTPPAPPNPLLPDFPPELGGGEMLPPPPPPEPPPELKPPVGLEDPPVEPPVEPPGPVGGGEPVGPPIPLEEDPFDREVEDRRRSDHEDEIDTVETTAKVGIAAVVVGSVVTTAVIGGTIYGVARLLSGRNKGESKEGLEAG